MAILRVLERALLRNTKLERLKLSATHIETHLINYINNCPTRCNTKQSIYYSASSLYMFRVSNTPIIRSTQNCKNSLQYCAATSFQRSQVNLATLDGGSCTKNMTSTVTTASSTTQLPPSNEAKLTWPRWREVAAQKI